MSNTGDGSRRTASSSGAGRSSPATAGARSGAGAGSSSVSGRAQVTTTSNRTTTTTVELEITRIQRENQNIFSNLVLLESEERVVIRNKSEQIRQLAKNYERLHELKQYSQAVNTICAAICHELRKKQLWASESLAHKVLDQKYKQSEFTPDHLPQPHEMDQEHEERRADIEQQFIDTTGTTYPEQSHYYYSNQSAGGEMVPSYEEPNRNVPIDFLLPKQDKSVNEMDSAELRDTTEKTIQLEREITDKQRELRRRKRELVEKCEERKVALSPEFEFSHEAHISTETDDFGVSDAYYAAKDFEEVIAKLADKLYKFRPPQHLAKKIANAFRQECEFYKCWIDEKYRKDAISWWVVECDNIAHGKHAAAIMNSTAIDDDKFKRALTREQVGDKSEEVVRRAMLFAAAQKDKAYVHNWYIKQVEPKIGKRARELHDVLSEKSFT